MNDPNKDKEVQEYLKKYSNNLLIEYKEDFNEFLKDTINKLLDMLGGNESNTKADDITSIIIKLIIEAVIKQCSALI